MVRLPSWRPLHSNKEIPLSIGEIQDPRKLLLGHFTTTRATGGVDRLLEAEITRHTADPYREGALRTAEKVILFGGAGFRTTERSSVELDFGEEERRHLVITAAREHASYYFQSHRRNFPPVAAKYAAAYFALTGEKFWTPDIADAMEATMGDLVEDHLGNGSFDTAGGEAATYRLVTNETPWGDGQRDDMAQTMMSLAKDYWDRSSSAVHTEVITSRLAAARVLMARSIVPVVGNPNRGIDLVF